MSEIVITGGAGFIGSNLLQRLRGKSVSIFDNFSTGSSRFLPGDVVAITGDIRDTDALRDAIRNASAVIHLAASGSVVDSVEDPQANFDVNVIGTFSVLEACRQAKVARLIIASTGGALIGNATPPVDESSLPKPISPYGASKLCGEAYCHAYAKSYGLRTIALRFANVYGPFSDRKKGAITKFMKCLLQDEPITIYGDGQATRDYLHVDDLCTGILAALSGDIEAGEVIHLASGVETSVASLASLVCEIADKPDHPVEYLPRRRGEVEKNFADFGKAKTALNFEPGIALTDGLTRTWNWFVDHRAEILNISSG